MNKPFVSVIIPVHNGARFLANCLDAVKVSAYDPYEVIVVDDASTDDSAAICLRKKLELLTMPHQSGPAAARNFGGARARGDVLLFIDADVLVQKETIGMIARVFADHPDVAAVFGSYDDRPAEKNFLSQYKNLQHHFVHQQAKPEAGTFWAGCGAIRKEVFEAAGGFDADSYLKPSIEDIELGCRLRQKGHRILLDRRIQVKHLKHWSLRSWLYADVFGRAVPWTKLILEKKCLVNDLNLQMSQRVSAALVCLSVLFISTAPFFPILFLPFFICLITVVGINHKFYSFLMRKKGIVFAAAALPFHFSYYVYSSAAFFIGWLKYIVFGRRVTLETVNKT